MNDNVIFVDTETTGLDPERHELWDIALIEADGT
jgi:oligoribonuclease (3'-5' exoribonuclease)